jgi:hypothetical protein
MTGRETSKNSKRQLEDIQQNGTRKAIIRHPSSCLKNQALLKSRKPDNSILLLAFQKEYS